MQTRNTTVLITGATSGIGLALAKSFHARGNRIIATGRRLAALESLARELPGTRVIQADLQHAPEIDRLVTFVQTEIPDLDILINNAGIQLATDWLTEASLPPRIKQEVQVNLLAPMMLTAQLLPQLSLRPEAAIVNVTSGLGLAARADVPVYCATKAGLRLFTQALRMQLEATNVRVVELIPPVTETAMTDGRAEKMTPPEKVAGALLKALEQDCTDVPVGPIRLFQFIHRLMPRLAQRIINK